MENKNIQIEHICFCNNEACCTPKTTSEQAKIESLRTIFQEAGYTLKINTQENQSACCEGCC